MPRLSVEGLSKRFTAQDDGVALAVESASFTVEPGECLALVGPSGSGKTTTLRLIAGLDFPDAGRICLDDVDVTEAVPSARPVAMVFQTLALLPHLSVAGNIALPLRLRGRDEASMAREAQAMADRFGIGGLLDRMPEELSGGERQRVALARALLQQPRILLLDEPFNGLDAPLRADLRRLLRQLRHDLGFSVIHVTHDQSEALASGDRVAILRAGRIEQCAGPEAVYGDPATRFVAGFIGAPPMNFLPGHIAASAGGRRFVPDDSTGRPAGELPLDIGCLEVPAGRVELGVRPEYVRPVAEAPSAWPFEFLASEYAGPDWVWDGTLAGHPFRLRQPHRGPTAPCTIPVALSPSDCRFFDSTSGRSLPLAS